MAFPFGFLVTRAACDALPYPNPVFLPKQDHWSWASLVDVRSVTNERLGKYTSALSAADTSDKHTSTSRNRNFDNICLAILCKVGLTISWSPAEVQIGLDLESLRIFEKCCSLRLLHSLFLATSSLPCFLAWIVSDAETGSPCRVVPEPTDYVPRRGSGFTDLRGTHRTVCGRS